ncbi:MAG: hypothetical protein NUV35_04360, partial [Syntrophomonadaceae bacterium]|nr:hypothetical protein [Syntrophomonadaceae bacterium]
MNRGLMVTLLALTLALTGCAGAIRNDAGGNGAPPPSTPGQGPGSGVGAPGNDFSLRVGAGVLALRDWDSEVDLRALLGPPRREEVRTLGPGSDTYQGSFVKELSFPGLDLTLFSPPDNGRSFWIMEMRVSG